MIYSMMHWESIICPRCVKFGDNCCLAEDKKRQEAVERHRCRAVWGDGAVLVPFSLFVFPRHKYYSRSSFSRSLPSRDSQLRGHTAASPPPPLRDVRALHLYGKGFGIIFPRRLGSDCAHCRGASHLPVDLGVCPAEYVTIPRSGGVFSAGDREINPRLVYYHFRAMPP